MKNATEIVSSNSASGRVSDRYAPCLTRLRGMHPSLTEAERRVAGYLFVYAGEAVTLSITEAARAAGVGAATITRLCAKLGYASYTEMKTALAVELLNPDYAAPDPIGDDDDTAAVIRKVLDIGAQSLKETTAVLDPAAMARAADAILRCRRVECYANGNITGPVAEIAQHRFLVIGVPCAAYTRGEQATAATLLRPGDVALGLSNSGTAPPVAAALAAAREAGATTIGVTYASDSPVARAAEIVLLTATRDSHLTGDSVASRLPMLAVLDILYACVALHKNRPRPEGASAQTRKDGDR